MNIHGLFIKFAKIQLFLYLTLQGISNGTLVKFCPRLLICHYEVVNWTKPGLEQKRPVFKKWAGWGNKNSEQVHQRGYVFHRCRCRAQNTVQSGKRDFGSLRSFWMTDLPTFWKHLLHRFVTHKMQPRICSLNVLNQTKNRKIKYKVYITVGFQNLHECNFK